eukprot:NODE_1295_length_567_cov_70.795367_g1220_i0.p2 GENE.NODE_1295_length_567_cov_70.795367_g1220_i0~~NODE_1295_length_567_cov_70.795367_g1220_i0.p2  ORF type:complete len:115 (-),score=15.54 NODE_1295_length_567_cov_70.795367_g1220_i0:148-492(-)
MMVMEALCAKYPSLMTWKELQELECLRKVCFNEDLVYHDATEFIPEDVEVASPSGSPCGSPRAAHKSELKLVAPAKPKLEVEGTPVSPGRRRSGTIVENNETGVEPQDGWKEFS